MMKTVVCGSSLGMYLKNSTLSRYHLTLYSSLLLLLRWKLQPSSTVAPACTRLGRGSSCRVTLWDTAPRVGVSIIIVP